MEDIFKKDDYIVTLKGDFSGSNCSKENYIFKIRTDSIYLKPEVDLRGSRTNGNGDATANKKKNLTDWRYATPEEIAEYDRLGEPYDITTLQKKPHDPLVGRYLKVINDKGIQHYPCKNGDYLQYVGKNVHGAEYWGAYTSEFKDDGTNNSRYYGGKAHTYDYFELMPVGFVPPAPIEKSSSSQFEKGKWYKFNTSEGAYKLYVKCGGIDHNNLLYQDNKYISNGLYQGGSSIGLQYIENPFLLTDLSEIQPYLPDGHPDKFPTKEEEEEWIPRVGDWVVLLSATNDSGLIRKYLCNDVSAYEKLIGKTCKISQVNGKTGIIKENPPYWICLDNISSAITSNQVRKATVDEIPVEHKAVDDSIPIEGGYYRVEDTSYSTSFWMIGKVTVPSLGSDAINKRGKAIVINYNNQYQKENSWCYEALPNRTFKPATQDEKEWLDACIEAGKYISFEEVYEMKAKSRGIMFDDSIPEVDNCETCNEEDVIEKSKESMNTYGLNIGDTLPQDILREWTGKGVNRYSSSKGWTKDTGKFSGDRRIIAFDTIHSIPAFLISGTGDVWARCEGFLEFKNSFGKLKPLTMQEIQEECKKKYPIGCRFKSTGSNHVDVLQKDFQTYRIVDNMIYAHSSAGLLYDTGKWAKLISVPATNQKDSFVLPEKWCIKLVSKEINNAVNSIKLWKNGELVWYEKGEYRDHYITNDGKYDSRIDPRYTEITFDQFKEYVLGKPTQTFKSRVKFKVGDEVTFITNKSYCYSEDGSEERGTVTNKGQSFIIGEISTKHPDLIKFTCDKSIWYMENDLELKKSAHISKEISLIEKAKNDYPIGSTFYDLVHKTPFVVDSHKFETFGDNNQLYVPVKYRPGFSNKTARLYKDGIWAKQVKTPIYSAGVDPYRESDDRITAMAMVTQSQQNDLRSMSAILASRMRTAGPRYNGLQQIFADPDDFKWDVIVPQELKSKSITTKLNTHVDRTNVELPEMKQKSKSIKF